MLFVRYCGERGLMKRCLSVAVGLLLTMSAALLAQTKPDAKPMALFNGKDLTGWKHAGPGSFEVRDGTLVTSGGMGLLWHEKEFDDFTLRLEFKVKEAKNNSGIFVRFPDPGNDPWVAIKEGYEIQICDTEKGNETGSIYNFKRSSEVA